MEYSTFGLQFSMVMSDSSLELATPASIPISIVSSHVVIIVRSGTEGLCAQICTYATWPLHATELSGCQSSRSGSSEPATEANPGCYKISRGSFLASYRLPLGSKYAHCETP